MAVRVYRSTDASAPVLTGVAGEFVALLDAVLVTGYGIKTPAGWTKPYTGTDRAAFRQAAGNQFYIRVLDHQLSGATRFANCRGYETMSDVDTGTGPFPTEAQVTSASGGITISYNLGSVPRPWIILADDRTVQIYCEWAGAGVWSPLYFGDIFSYVPADAYRTMIVGGNELDRFVGEGQFSNSISSAQSFHYIARRYDGTGTSLQVGRHGFSALVPSGSATLGAMNSPNPIGQRMHVSPIYVHEIATPLIRGRQRGAYHFLHNSSGVGTGDTFNGSGLYAGKSFELILTGTHGGVFCVETSDTWDTSA